MKVSRFHEDAFEDTLRYIIEIPRNEFDISSKESFGVLFNGVIHKIQDAMFDELWPQLRQQAIERFVATSTDDLVDMLKRHFAERLLGENNVQAKSGR